MKKLILTTICACVLVGGAGIVSAQPLDVEHKRPEFARPMPEDLAKRLNLTAEQQTKATELRRASREKMEPLMKEKREIDAKLETARKENMAEFEKILTDEQKLEFEKIKSEHRKFDRPHRNFGKPDFEPKKTTDETK